MKSASGKILYFLTYLLSVNLGAIFFVLEKIRMPKTNFRLKGLIIKLFGVDVYEIRKEYDVLEKSLVTKAIIIIPSRGCSHYFNNGGCAMCGFNKETEEYRLREWHPMAISILTEIILDFITTKFQEHQVEPDVIIFFTAGSFINKEELSAESRERVFTFFLDSPAKRMVIESRAEYIIKNRQLLQVLAKRANVHQKNLEIAIGLETSDDKVRNEVIRKALSKAQYEKTIAILRELGIISSSYILIGAPYLRGDEITKKAVESALYAWKAGCIIVNLEAYCVQRGTPWEELYNNGQLAMPTLWNLVDVIKKIDQTSHNWYLGSFSDWPEPISVPQNCTNCNDQVLKILDKVRETHDISQFNVSLKCSCRSEWGKR